MGTLYENIVELCREKGIAPSNLGLEITGSRSFMTELKSGRKKGINAETARRIADYFNVPVDRVLFGRTDRDTELELAEYLDDLRFHPEKRMLLAATKNMSREQIEMMARFAESIRGDDD